jgi:hypothetical protein
MTTKKEAEKKGDTMRLWNEVSKTDVDHTKEVSFGRKFTAIDAHSQIMEATRLFGPVGEGWGYENKYGEVHFQDGRVMVWCDVTFWWSEFGSWEGMATPGHRREFGPVRGGAVMQALNKDGSFKQPDTDAYKKASTDGLTKLLSHLGFNADVFLGMFDDNKYVQGLQKEKDVEATAAEKAYAQDRAKFIEAIQACKKPENMDAVLENYKLWMAGLPVATATEMRSWVMQQREELASGSK